MFLFCTFFKCKTFWRTRIYVPWCNGAACKDDEINTEWKKKWKKKLKKLLHVHENLSVYSIHRFSGKYSRCSGCQWKYCLGHCGTDLSVHQWDGLWKEPVHSGWFWCTVSSNAHQRGGAGDQDVMGVMACTRNSTEELLKHCVQKCIDLDGG